MRRQYLRTKILGIRFHQPPTTLDLAGVTTLKRTDYALKLEVDTTMIPIEAVMQEILQVGTGNNW